MCYIFNLKLYHYIIKLILKVRVDVWLYVYQKIIRDQEKITMIVSTSLDN